MLLGQTQHVMIVRTGQSLVARDDDVAGLAALDLGTLVEINMLDFGRVVQNIGNRGADLEKIRLHIVQLLPCLAQLGGRDQIHRVCDLERLLHTVNAGADLLYACHAAFT